MYMQQLWASLSNVSRISHVVDDDDDDDADLSNVSRIAHVGDHDDAIYGDSYA